MTPGCTSCSLPVLLLAAAGGAGEEGWGSRPSLSARLRAALAHLGPTRCGWLGLLSGHW